MNSFRTFDIRPWALLLGAVMSVLSLAIPVQAQAQQQAEPGGQELAGMTVDAAIDFRRKMGFRADRPFVERLQTAPENEESRRRWSMGMTPEEEREFQFRLDLQLATSDLVERLPSQYPEYFGGLFTDQPAGGIVNVALVAETPPDVAGDIRSSFAYPQNLRFVVVERSMQELTDLQNAVWDGAKEFGISVTIANEWDNRLEVGVSGTPDRRR